MPLITCGDCGSSVSDRAPACPKCGAPIATKADVAAVHVPLTTTQTTSKRLKGHILIASLLFWGGVIWLFTGGGIPEKPGLATFGALAIVVGLVWYVVTKFRIWWHHK